jgi:hypothetical protein
MPRFFFDLRNAGGVDHDELGIELPGVEAAYLEAHSTAVSLWAEARLRGAKPTYIAFEIRDTLDRVVLELPFSEAIGADLRDTQNSRVHMVFDGAQDGEDAA